MKASSGLFLFFLILWMGGSTYWYVCKIKKHCSEISTEISENSTSDNAVVNQNFSEENNVSEKTKEKIIEDIKEKIINGYIVYNFPKNSIENNNIEASFNEFADNLKIYLEKNSSDKIEIIGHTDDVGNESANIKLGMKRALFIKRKLKEKGIKEDQMVLSSKGKKEPVSSNKTEEGRTKNRRVVIKLIKN